MNKCIAGFIACFAVTTPIHAYSQLPTHTDFSHYILAMSWSPEYCAGKSNTDNLQCTRPYGFVAHGLWPQQEKGWPENCKNSEYLSNALIERMLPIMPSTSLIIHEWKKHGSCSNLNAESYFEHIQRAFSAVKLPPALIRPHADIKLQTTDLIANLLAVNPQWSADNISVHCNGRNLKEVRICLNKDLSPRTCGSAARSKCQQTLMLRAVR